MKKLSVHELEEDEVYDYSGLRYRLHNGELQIMHRNVWCESFMEYNRVAKKVFTEIEGKG